MTDVANTKQLARTLAEDELKELSIRTKDGNTYNIYDAQASILERIKAHVTKYDSSLDDVLVPLVDAAIRDADRSMCDPKSDRTRHFQIGQLDIFVDLDLDATLRLGQNERIRVGAARVDHVKRSLRLDTDNLIAVNAAFADKREYKQGLIDVMEPLDPRTTVTDVITEAGEQAA